MVKLSAEALAALKASMRGDYALISKNSERVLVRLGLIDRVQSSLTVKGGVTLRRDGDAPTDREWALVELAFDVSSDLCPF
jgi:hypothetical protein